MRRAAWRSGASRAAEPRSERRPGRRAWASAERARRLRALADSTEALPFMQGKGKGKGGKGVVAGECYAFSVGRCRKGDECHLRHNEESLKAQTEKIAQREAEEKLKHERELEKAPQPSLCQCGHLRWSGPRRSTREGFQRREGQSGARASNSGSGG